MDPQSPNPQPAPMSRKAVLIATAGGAVVAALIVFGAVLPAEYHKDPLGVGKLTGIAKLWAPSEKEIADTGSVKRARYYDTPFRSDVVEIPLTDPSGGIHGPELEYKVRMAKDATLIYSWEVVDPKEKDAVHYDFHGHTTPAEGSDKAMDVSTWKQAYGNSGQGALTAPFDGIQGWQFTNATAKPIVIRVKLAGFYKLIPPTEVGNEEGIVANLKAPQSRPWLLDPTADIDKLTPPQNKD
jgi:hypothetical protein